MATVCATDQLDWYTTAVGETPCRTYERLRQICDSRYVVDAFKTQTPGDVCDSQVNTCCCNSIAWNLSMLCFNCQNAGSAEADPDGEDAGTGAYQIYLNDCGAADNGALPTSIQDAVCTNQIDIRPPIYPLYWADGPWFYTFFRENMQTELSQNPAKNLTNCPKTTTTSPAATSTTSSTGSTSTSTTSSASSPTSSGNDGKVSTAAIAGGAVGAVVFLIAAFAAFALWYRRRTARKHYGDEITPASWNRDEMVLEPFIDPPFDPAMPPPSYNDLHPKHAGKDAFGDGSVTEADDSSTSHMSTVSPMAVSTVAPTVASSVAPTMMSTRPSEKGRLAASNR